MFTYLAHHLQCTGILLTTLFFFGAYYLSRKRRKIYKGLTLEENVEVQELEAAKVARTALDESQNGDSSDGATHQKGTNAK